MFAPVANILQESGAGILDLVEHCGADIEPLEKAGVPAFSPIQDSRFYFNYHHTAADTLDKNCAERIGGKFCCGGGGRVCAGKHGKAIASLSVLLARQRCAFNWQPGANAPGNEISTRTSAESAAQSGSTITP